MLNGWPPDGGADIVMIPIRKRRTNTLITICVVYTLAASVGCHKEALLQHSQRPDLNPKYDGADEGHPPTDPQDAKNARLKLKSYRARFEAAQFHVRQGVKHLEQHENQLALGEFETALKIDPSCLLARQELDYTKQLLVAALPQPSHSPGEDNTASVMPNVASSAGGTKESSELMQKPPALNPFSREPITLKMLEDSRTVFRTLGKLAGVNVIFDPEFPEKKINIDLANVTIQQALHVACIEAKAFWKPVTSNIILVLPDTTAKRKQEEEQVLEKVYLHHAQTPQELTEMSTSLQQMLELRHIQPVPRDNAILIRDTPDKILLASRLIKDSDRGRSEVVVQISVLQARRDRARSLGIQPGSSTTLAFAPSAALGPTGAVALGNLGKITQGDFALTIPNAVATALMTDSTTRLIQNPQVRVSDGESARLRVGDRVPVATGSFQSTAGFGNVINTQFQYVDVGVNIDLVPHVHPDRSVSMKLAVEVSSLNGKVNIGGVEQPVISQRRIEHEIRLQEGEVSILGGLVEHSQNKSVSGIPGLSHLPLLRYLFSGEDVSNSENEVLIVVTPQLVRSRDFARESLQALSVGTDSETLLRQQEDGLAPVAANPKQGMFMEAGAVVTNTADLIENPPTLRLEPSTLSIKTGETAAIRVQVDNIEDLFSSSLLLRYDPHLLAVEDVQHGDFLSGGTQEVAIIQRIDKDKGQAGIFTTRQPNTAGVNGKGVLLTILVKRLADGPASLQVVEVGSRTSRQKIVPIKIIRGDVALP
jgi:general secretion pathway protein D